MTQKLRISKEHAEAQSYQSRQLSLRAIFYKSGAGPEVGSLKFLNFQISYTILYKNQPCKRNFSETQYFGRTVPINFLPLFVKYCKLHFWPPFKAKVDFWYALSHHQTKIQPSESPLVRNGMIQKNRWVTMYL